MEKIFPICPISGWHAWEGGPYCTHEFELTHGNKNQGPSFTCTWMGQRLDLNIGREFILPHYPWISPTQSPVGPVTRLIPGIRPLLGAINSAPE